MGVLKVICSIVLGAVAFGIFLFGLYVFFGVLGIMKEYPFATLFAGSYLILGLLLIVVGALMLFGIIRWNRTKRPKYPPPYPYPPPPPPEGKN